MQFPRKDYKNPLYAITMIRHDITAGLFAPVELLVTENDGRAGAKVTYVRPSSLMIVEANPPLLAAAQDLDRKTLEAGGEGDKRLGLRPKSRMSDLGQ